MAERAMQADDQDSAPYPPTAARVHAGLERVGISASALALQCGVEETVYWDLERYDSEVFDCVSVAELPLIAQALEMPVMELLFGEEPPTAMAEVSYAELARSVREEASRRGVGVDALGAAVGWELEGLVRDPEAVGDLNLVGLYDVCRAVGVEWLAVLAFAEGRGRRTRR